MNNQIKIFKSATKKSILDVRPALHYHQKKINGEEVYKGSIIFTINEYGGSQKQLQAFVPKSVIKMVLHLILQHHFPRFYSKGFSSYGGSVATKRARIFSIRFDSERNKFVFQIDEGEGKVAQNGAIQMVKKETTVMSFLSYEDTLKMAHEALDYIRHTELLSLSKGKPLYTIMNINREGRLDNE